MVSAAKGMPGSTDLHAMTEAPESQMHVVGRVRCVLQHTTNHNAVAQKIKSPNRR